jgi:hypothetical protein
MRVRSCGLTRNRGRGWKDIGREGFAAEEGCTIVICVLLLGDGRHEQRIARQVAAL